MKTIFTSIFIFLTLFPSSFSYAKKMDKIMSTHLSDKYTGTLKAIINKKYLRVLTSNNSFNYFIYKGKQKGYEYELVKNFVNSLNKSLKLSKKELQIQFEIIPVPRDQLLPMLKQGYGDIAAAGLTITNKRKNKINFSSPYNEVNELIVANTKLVPHLKTLKDLSGKKIAVRKSSSYFESIIKLNQFLRSNRLPPVKIIKVDEHLETEEIMELVGLGVYDITAADSHIAKVGVEVYENIRLFDTLILRDKSSIAWAVPKQSPKLLKRINSFMKNYKKGSLYGNIIINKYFKNINKIRSQNFSHDNKNRTISKYDDIIKKYGKVYNFDWRLLAAIAYQESRFDQEAQNKSGATGVFQIKVSTASEKYINIKNIKGAGNSDNNIHAGIKYLSWIKKRYYDTDQELSEKERIRFTIGSYNAGPAAITRARKKAKLMNLNPDKWFRNVEIALLVSNKKETVKYVSEINKRFIAYSLLGF